MRRFLIITAVLGLLALYALAVATGHGSTLSQYFWQILAFSTFILLFLLFILCSQLWELWQNRRKGVFGSKIAMRLAGMFMLVAVLPGLFLFGVSAQFISHSIQSWFGTETEEALARSLNLSRSALDLAADTSLRQAEGIQTALSVEIALQQDPRTLLAQADKDGRFSQLALYDTERLEMAAQHNPDALPAPELNRDILAAVRERQTVSNVEDINHTLYAQGWLALPQTAGEDYILFFRQPIPQQVGEDINLIESARARYAEVSYAKAGLQTFFLFTLLMATLFAIFTALVIALYFAQRFTAPILSLAAGARAVAQGDFSQKQKIYRGDELGRLTSLFNHMTAQLDIARSEQEAARQYLECMLSGLSSGVITLDEQGYLNTWNAAAENILLTRLAPLAKTGLESWHENGVVPAIAAETLCRFLETLQDGTAVQVAYTAADEARILLGRAAPLPEHNGGIVLVFEDVTALVRAQKEAAWGEVAQRLAHEIRNPLTPIQLAAERLSWKLADKLDEKDAAMLNRSTETIVNQVSAMKGMVEAFRNYAKTPQLNLEAVCLNKLITELLVLYESTGCTFTTRLDDSLPAIHADTGAIRQVLHNLLKNGAEAAAEAAEPTVWVSTRLEDGKAVLTVENNGKGFSSHMLHHAFDPYVTDKPSGTGLGLPVVKKIVEEHKGRIFLGNRPEGGASVRINLHTLQEPVKNNEKQQYTDSR